MSLAVNSQGVIYVADMERHYIWRLPAEKGKAEMLWKVAAPRSVYVDAADQVWVLSAGKNQLLKIAPDGKQQVVVSGQPFKYPNAVIVDADQNAYVSDGYGRTIWKIAAKEKPQKWVSGDPLVNPIGLAWRGKNLLVVDPRAKAVFQITPAAELTKLSLDK